MRWKATHAITLLDAINHPRTIRAVTGTPVRITTRAITTPPEGALSRAEPANAFGFDEAATQPKASAIGTHIVQQLAPATKPPLARGT
jgi:hypothetical protein